MMKKCEICLGKGIVDDNGKKVKCPFCDGKGEYRSEDVQNWKEINKLQGEY